MAVRQVDDGFWTDTAVAEFSKDAKTLYLWSFTNKHLNPAGLYEVPLKFIAMETGIDAGSLPGLFDEISGKVEWISEQNLIWVKNFIRRQTRSPKWLKGVASSLELIHNNGTIQALLQYNRERFGIDIPYQYPMHTVSIPYADPIDTVSIPSNATAKAKAIANANAKEGGVVRGGAEMLALLRAQVGWVADPSDGEWLAGFVEDTGAELENVKACVDWWSGKKPASHRGEWKNRLRNWMKKEREKHPVAAGTNHGKIKGVKIEDGR